MKDLNDILESDQGKFGPLAKPPLGVSLMKTAYATLKGFRVVRALTSKRTKTVPFIATTIRRKRTS